MRVGVKDEEDALVVEAIFILPFSFPAQIFVNALTAPIFRDGDMLGDGERRARLVGEVMISTSDDDGESVSASTTTGDGALLIPVTAVVGESAGRFLREKPNDVKSMHGIFVVEFLDLDLDRLLVPRPPTPVLRTRRPGAFSAVSAEELLIVRTIIMRVRWSATGDGAS